MTITLEVPASLESQIRTHAASRDAIGVRRILTEALDPVVAELMREDEEELSDAAFEAIADQLAFLANVPALTDDACTRAGIYAEHD